MNKVSMIQKQILPFTHQNLLVVDDTALNRELIVNYLQGAGFNNIQTAEDGIEALEKMESFKPDILILDIVMPRMNGVEVIKHLRANPVYTQLPIIVQTSLAAPEERMDAWGYGATDVITKPIHKLELLSRVKVQLENSFLIKELEAYQDKASADIAQALTVQNALLPSADFIHHIKSSKDLNVNYIFIPSRFLSGDLWGLTDPGNENLNIWMCDFTGKGIQAALNTFRIHTIINSLKGHSRDPIQIIKKVNKMLVDIMPVGNFATFFYGVINQEEDKLYYTAAGCPHPLVYYPERLYCELGESSGIPLGVNSQENYLLRELPFPKGASLILYSDMFWEERGIPGISLLPERLSQFIKELNGKSFIEVIQQQLEYWGGCDLADDLTLIEITRAK